MITLRQIIGTALVLSLTLGASTGCSRKLKAERHLARANQYFAQKQYDKALLEYLVAFRLQPTDSHAIRGIGISFYETGEKQQSAPFLVEAEQKLPEDVEIRSRLGMLYLAAKERDKARAEADFVLARDPLNETAIFLLLNTVVRSEQVEVTERRLLELSTQHPNKATFHLALAQLYSRKNDPQAAEQALKRAEALEPTASGVQLAMGQFLFSRQDLAGAAKAFQAAAQNAPPKSPVRFAYAEFKLKTGEVQEGKKLLEEIASTTPESALVWIYLAEIAFSERKFDEAQRLVKNAIDREPANTQALLLRARVDLAQNKTSQAFDEINQIASRNPELPAAHYHLALVYASTNDVAKAMGSLNRAIALAPEYIDALLLLARIYIQRGDPASAVLSVSQVVKRDPGNQQAQLLLAAAYRARGTPDDAVAIYEKLLREDPRNSDVAFLLGITFRQQGKKLEARGAFAKVIELTPDSYIALAQLTELDVAEGNFKAAVDRIDERIRKSPESPLLQFLLGQVYLAQKQPEKAEAALLKAISLNKDFQAAYVLLAQLYVQSGRSAEAVGKLDEVLRKNPKDEIALLKKALILEQQKDFSKAAETYERILEVNRNSAIALNNVSYVYAEHLGKLDRAYELAQQASRLMPNDARVTDTLAWICFKRGDYARAQALLTTCADTLATEPEVQLHLAMACYMQGDEVRARDCFGKAVTLRGELAENAELQQCLAIMAVVPAKATDEDVAILKKCLAEHADDVMARLRLGAIAEAQGNAISAAQQYEAALKANPKAVVPLTRLAAIYANIPDQKSRAMELAKKARELAPGDLDVAHLLGWLCYRERDYERALLLLKESTRTDPVGPERLWHVALAQFAMGQVTEAVEAAHAALQLDSSFPERPEAQRFVEMAEWVQNPMGAETVVAKAGEILRLNPDYVPALMVSALAREKKGEQRTAQETYERILTIYPRFTPAVRRLAIAYAALGTNDPRALQLATQAKAALPTDSELAYVIGKLRYRRGDYAGGLNALTEAQQQRPNDPDVLYHLGFCQYHLKHERESKELLVRALALDGNTHLAPEARRIVAGLSLTPGNQ